MNENHPTLNIRGRSVGVGHPVYVVAEMSANHNHDLSRALRIIEAAEEVGADALVPLPKWKVTVRLLLAYLVM